MDVSTLAAALTRAEGELARARIEEPLLDPWWLILAHLTPGNSSQPSRVWNWCGNACCRERVHFNAVTFDCGIYYCPVLSSNVQ
jgi:hypothetical protein